jgi:hypothetical protein
VARDEDRGAVSALMAARPRPKKQKTQDEGAAAEWEHARGMAGRTKRAKGVKGVSGRTRSRRCAPRNESLKEFALVADAKCDDLGAPDAPQVDAKCDPPASAPVF